MNLEIGIAVASLVSSLVAVIVSLSRKDERKAEAQVEAVHLLGKKYASLGWAYSRMQRDSAESAEKARKHAVEGFIIADTAADGKRDFTDKQAGVYVDAHL